MSLQRTQFHTELRTKPTNSKIGSKRHRVSAEREKCCFCSFESCIVIGVMECFTWLVNAEFITGKQDDITSCTKINSQSFWLKLPLGAWQLLTGIRKFRLKNFFCFKFEFVFSVQDRSERVQEFGSTISLEGHHKLSPYSRIIDISRLSRWKRSKDKLHLHKLRINDSHSDSNCQTGKAQLHHNQILKG